VDGPLVIPRELRAVVVLLRHGESEYIAQGRFQGQADSPLSPLGERQAALAAARLAGRALPPVLPIPAIAPLEIVHSPLSRAAATASAAARAIGAAAGGSPPPMRADDGLAEIAQGSWEGRDRADIRTNDGDILEAWRRDPLHANAPGGERVLDAAVRARGAVVRAVDHLAAVTPGAGAAPQDRSTRVSGYPGPAGPDTPWSLLVAHDGIFKLVLLTLLDIPLERFWAFPIELCAISVVELRDGRAVLRAHNLTEHLADLATSVAPIEVNGAL
jgi:broad specificity phosphatase PhoE